jgi:thiosulfate/3-mercaptopyruvate sulfurtransferase
MDASPPVSLPPLVSADWLAGELAAPDLLVLDASYTATLPGSAVRDPVAGFAPGHLPGARLLGLDTLVDPASPLPSTLPPLALLEKRLGALGITPATRVVLYAEGPHHTECRAWWLLGMAGVPAALLDGGLSAWTAAGGALDSGVPAPAAPTAFRAAAPLQAVRTLAEMRDTAEQVADARSAARFTGAEPDPRPGLAPGHMPGARNLPHGRFFTPDGRWRSREEIKTLFAEAGIDPARPLVATCGSGITAAVIVFAAHLLGFPAALYDGSWSEWGADPSTAKALGPA